MNTSLRLFAAASVVALAVTTAPTVHAQSACSGGSKVLAAIWEKWGENIKKKGCKSSEECLANAEKKENLAREMLQFWNEQAQNGWATIGPRQLVIGGGVNDGRVILGSSRLFVSHQVLDSADYEATITKEGDGAAEVTLSLSDGTNCLQGNSVSFAKADKPGTKKVLRVRNATGLLAVVKVDAKGGAFDYRFTFTKGITLQPVRK